MDARLPISLIIDDGAPINPAYYLHPEEPHRLAIPAGFTRRFAAVCRARGVYGKFSVLPVPSTLGRIDRKVNRVPTGVVQAFVRTVREEIAPYFDITPEMLTHQQAVRLPKLNPTHIYEDVWIDRATVDEMVPYFSLALQILKNVGLPANGFTSPWYAGIKNEKRYAEAIGRSQWRVHRRKFTWYFLHVLDKGPGQWPWLAWKNGQVTVMTVPATTTDPFWRTQEPVSRRGGRQLAQAGVDAMLSVDGRRGRVAELLAQPAPIVFVTHWQSLFSNGAETGLWGLERLLDRVAKRVGERVEWMTCSELARRQWWRSGGR